MRTLSRYSNRQHVQPILILVVAMTALIHAVPARLFSSTRNNLAGSTTFGSNKHAALPSIPEEELELESLKNSGSGTNSAFQEVGAATKKSTMNEQPYLSKLGSVVVDGNTASTSAATTTIKPPAYVKKPENEETPALSDNANSLKYGGETAELEEVLANLAHIPPSKGPSLSVSSSSLQNGIAGITSPLGESILQQQQQKRTRTLTGMERMSRTRGLNLEVDYTPQEIAEYIFTRGDELSVELALNDFVQQGVITPQEAIKFLEDVKAELNVLRSRYASTMGRIISGVDLPPRDGPLHGSSPLSGRGWDVQAISKKQSNNMGLGNFLGSGYPPSFNSVEQMSSYYSPSLSSGLRGKPVATSSKDPLSLGTSIEDLDYEEIVEKLRDADTKMREYALEGIIYQLARELFSLGLQQSPGNSVPTFTTFIENLALNGNISKDLERSVLETLVQALVGAAHERGLLIAKSEGQLTAPKPTSEVLPPILRQKKNA